MTPIVLAITGLYRLAIAGVRTVDGSRSGRELARLFAPSLVPIALAYAAAHYVSLLLFQGQMICRCSPTRRARAGTCSASPRATSTTRSSAPRRSGTSRPRS